ncbi:54S ribosomal protein L4 mitochondrial [Diatrype stigma]|uniref:Large ribosomal subunit protein uL29m n=1 Tax=Diatrype stigma TaxID=117547 RepID=A0AAN9V540_9PEZI
MASAASIRPAIGRILRPYVALQTSQITPLAILSSTSGSLQQRQQQQQPQQQQRCPFSSTPSHNERRPRRDNNRLRGLSTIYRSGPRFRMNVQKKDMPKAAPDYDPAQDVVVDPDHGLWQFFYGKDKVVLTPEEDAEHGRAWTVEELRRKSWEDLHRLWWVCVKERNRIVTHRHEKKTQNFVSGKEETSARLAEVRRTMRCIKHTLTERFYAWEDARRLAESDPEIDLSGKGQAFNPASFYEEEAAAAGGEGEGEGEYQATEGQQQQSQEDGKQVLEPELQPEQQQEKMGAETVDPSTIPPSSRPAETQNTTRP